MLNFDFLEVLRPVPVPKFVYDFPRDNISHVAFYKPTKFQWLPLLLEILGYVRIIIICFPACDAIGKGNVLF